jgi:hypothetical protein
LSLNTAAASARDDEGIVGVLENRTWSIRSKRVPESWVCSQQFLKDVGDKQEHVWGQGVFLPEAPAARDPAAWHSV